MKPWRLTLAAIGVLALLTALANNIFPYETHAAWTWLTLQHRQNAGSLIEMGHRPPFSPGSRSILLPPAEAGAIMHLCSRHGPKVEGTWQATEADIDVLESNLQQISGLRCIWGTRSLKIVDPQSFYRQYVAIVVAGRRLIYVNAFYPIESLPFSVEHFVNVCDGGPYFWGAMFDPATLKYSDLSINGRA
jgi:hypothetical protein